MYDIEDKCADYVLKEAGESSMSDRAVRLFFSRVRWLEFYGRIFTFLSIFMFKLLSVIWT